MIRFNKAVEILDLLFQGKPPKEIQYELGVSATEVYETKKKFPLFTGLTRHYDKG